MRILTMQGEGLKDILDWYWLADEFEIELEIQPGATLGIKPEIQCIALTRKPGEEWGLSFSEVLFDGLRSCENTCSFCFMRMLPKGLRPALYVRDDDYRLSFLHGNFVTLTNISDEDVQRIVTMHLSPLNVSLHAVDPEVRRQMMGKNEARGIQVLEELLKAGIELKAQIVLMPGINDGAVLEETLDWVETQHGILATGIVPYGYTRYASTQQGFDTPWSARAVIEQVQRRAPRVQLADEFFVKAWPGKILAHLPPAGYYSNVHLNEYPLIEDGVGMLRCFLDESQGIQMLEDELAQGACLVTGEAFAAVLREVLPQRGSSILPIKNNFFGGNVNVAGLLTAEDVVTQAALRGTQHLILPAGMFNDDGLTLDNKTAADIAAALNTEVKVLDFSPGQNASSNLKQS